MRVVPVILFMAVLAACSAPPGPSLPVNPAERRALEDGDAADFWQRRAARGDPAAHAALSAMRLRPGPLVAVGRASFRLYRARQRAPAPEPVISLALARAHAEAVTQDRAGTPARLSARQVAAYHHRVLSGFGLPPFSFGATQITGRSGEAVLLAPFWCAACDPVP
ncbi:MAG: hypothetical protein KDK12_05035 [Rhodobacteraceae bacterium]|nr:hypothetical protein [Paracoccaceae bacterium]